MSSDQSMAVEMTSENQPEPENGAQDSRDASMAMYWLFADNDLHYSHDHAYEHEVSSDVDLNLNSTLNNSVDETAENPVMTSTPKPCKYNIPVLFSKYNLREINVRVQNANLKASFTSRCFCGLRGGTY